MASGRRGRAVRVAHSRLCRRHYCVITKAEGLKAPGYSYSRLSDVFSLTTHYSLLITHRSTLITHRSKASEGHEARRANSRGFLNPWNN